MEEADVLRAWEKTFGPGIDAAESGKTFGGLRTLTPGAAREAFPAVGASIALESALAATALTPGPPSAPALEATALTPAPRGSDREAAPPAPGESPPRGDSPVAVAIDAPRYEVGAELGRGGMGVVHRARQTCLAREVALKRIHAGKATAGNRARFVAEAIVTGSLDHPGIVPVHELGEDDDGPFLAMKLVSGTSWRRLLHPETEAERARAASHDLGAHLRILAAVANAVAFAHSRGVLHRDLKPENVMVGEFGEILVVDWGLAIDFRDPPPDLPRAPLRSSASSPAGTPCYMAPELAEGRAGDMGPWTDVYLLGAILHEILTGRPPHAGKTFYMVVVAAMKSELGTFGPEVPEELAAIVRKAMARAPRERHPTAAAFRAELEAFLRHGEAHAAARRGLALLGELRAASDAAAIHRLHAKATYAFEHALEVWDGVREAATGRVEADRLLLEHALATDDLALAERLAGGATPPDRARVVALRDRLAARARELEALREAARRQDWSAVSGPLSLVFVAAGVLGGATAIATDRLRGEFAGGRAASIGVVLWIAWGASTLALGGLAWRRLGRAEAARSLLSSRILGTWGAVAFGCLLIGVCNGLRGLPPFFDSCYSAFLIAVGFAAMAFQTRLWLLVPALAFFACGVVMAVAPERGQLVFGGAWLVVLAGFGIGLRLGLPLEPRVSRPS